MANSRDTDPASTADNSRLSNPPLLTVRQAALYMRVKPKTIYSWVAQGRLRCLRAGNRIRFRLSDLERWLGVPERRKDAKAP